MRSNLTKPAPVPCKLERQERDVRVVPASRLGHDTWKLRPSEGVAYCKLELTISLAALCLVQEASHGSNVTVEELEGNASYPLLISDPAVIEQGGSHSIVQVRH
eukprot:CAMPEP_0115842024 /NCGR_PEP_ID=MMETSP0287-20121206/7588_1 /TAXON_ID=412157 /ORGANISM="Chrysochromulina rotalis, Strain UIO044" /LENGTH=103 /DNA_ID=CAMNT_0003295683 /DNA_START=894 /DNA_END=1205 /DNA_ORIENTATION=-